jgi:sugar phosphate isomerase/epimerase
MIREKERGVAMSVISISTMWAQQDRFEDIEAFRRTVADFGYTAIEVSHSTDGPRLEQLLKDGPIGLSSLHAPTPRSRLADGRWNSDANLASPDEAERRAAMEATCLTLDYAGRAGLEYVVVHLGGVGNTMTDFERQLRRLYDSGIRDGDEVENLRLKAREHRTAGAEAHLEAATRSLRELTDHAAKFGIAIGLENRYHYHEIPNPAEAADLVADYPNEVAGYWHDVGHAEVQHRIGLIDRHAWFPRLSTRTIGTHLHDVDGIGDHRAPGNGDVDWSYIARGLPKTALRVFEIDQRQPDSLVASAPQYLRDRGVIE